MQAAERNLKSKRNNYPLDQMQMVVEMRDIEEWYLI